MASHGRVKVAKVTSLHKDIAYAMATADVRILAPIPGKSAIGVEVPNRQRQLVAVADVLGSPEAKALEAPLTVAIGRDIDGKPGQFSKPEDRVVFKGSRSYCVER